MPLDAPVIKIVFAISFLALFARFVTLSSGVSAGSRILVSIDILNGI
jgi:hypothetical protein